MNPNFQKLTTHFVLYRRWEELKKDHRGVQSKTVHIKKEPVVPDDKKPKGKSSSDPFVVDSGDDSGESTSGSEAENEDEENPNEEEQSGEEEENQEDEDENESDEEVDSNENENIFFNQFDKIYDQDGWFEEGMITGIQSD